MPAEVEQFSAAAAAISAVQRQTDADMRLAQHKVSPEAVRAFVAKWLIGAFIVYLLGSAGFIIFGGECATADRTKDLVDLGKSLFLPVITFVLGYFFAKAD